MVFLEGPPSAVDVGFGDCITTDYWDCISTADAGFGVDSPAKLLPSSLDLFLCLERT